MVLLRSDCYLVKVVLLTFTVYRSKVSQRLLLKYCVVVNSREMFKTWESEGEYLTQGKIILRYLR